MNPECLVPNQGHLHEVQGLPVRSREGFISEFML